MKLFQKNSILKMIVMFIFSLLLGACGGGGGTITETGAPTNNGNNILPGSTNKSVMLSWEAPLSYSDGSNLSDLQGHHIYMKTGSGSFVRIHTIYSPGLLSYFVDNLSPNTYTFAVTAFTSQGIESSFSQSVTITL